MPHSVRQRKLGRTTPHRLALFRNQLAALVRSERIITTLPKAKELRPIAERVVTLGKRATLHSRRLAQRWLADRELLKKLFDELAPRMGERAGGYLRIVKLGPRRGDAAEMAVLEFVDFQLTRKESKDETKAKGKRAKGEEPEAAGDDSEAAAAGEAKPKEKAAKSDRKAARAEAKAKAKIETKGKTHQAKTSTTRKVGGS
jgi:large subunit ribosomal protein L17